MKIYIITHTKSIYDNKLDYYGLTWGGGDHYLPTEITVRLWELVVRGGGVVGGDI